MIILKFYSHNFFALNWLKTRIATCNFSRRDTYSVRKVDRENLGLDVGQFRQSNEEIRHMVTTYSAPKLNSPLKIFHISL